MFTLRKRKLLKPVSAPPPNHLGSANPMCGFQWSPTRTAPSPMSPGDNGYCLRDAMCTLMDWQVDSEAWASFPEWPNAGDVPRLAEHLELRFIDIPYEFRPDEDLRHPGLVMVYILGIHEGGGHIRHMENLEEYCCTPAERLDALVIDTSQPALP
jgi:hypothetical protein